MEEMPVALHQLVEQMVQTRLLTSILQTLNEISFKLQNPEHQIGVRNFDSDVMDEAIIEIRECWQKYFAEQLSKSPDSLDQP